MSPPRWVRRQLDRPIAGHKHSTATVCWLLLLIAAAGLILTTRTHPAVEAHEHIHTKLTIQASNAPNSRWTPDNAADTKAAADTFLGSYLAFLYGQGPASQVNDATSALIRSLQQGPQRVPPGIKGLHPRVLSIQVTPQGPSRAIAIAIVSDGEVVHYPVRVVLTDSGGLWLVSGLGSTP